MSSHIIQRWIGERRERDNNIEGRKFVKKNNREGRKRMTKKNSRKKN